MKKVLQYILMTVMMAFAIGTSFANQTEAAEMVVVPVINNTENTEIESTFYDNVLDCVKQQEKYEYIDGDEVSKALEKYTVKGQLPDEQALRSIAEELNADLVVAVELNELSYTKKPFTTAEDFRVMKLLGTTVSFNRETNKFVTRKLREDETLDNGYYARQNVPLRYWARTVQHEMHRVMNFKGLGLQKQKISKF